MSNILEKIISAKRQEIAKQKEIINFDFLKMLSRNRPKIYSFRQALLDSPTGIISEFKRKSPSTKGWIFRDAEVEKIVPGYAAAGAAALSVLTDGRFFGGTLKDMRVAASLVEIPVLRKDFILDDYQVYQVHILGADVVLLIASILTKQQTRALASTAKALGLEVLLEIHMEEELDYINEYIDVVGVNNRNLSTLRTNIQTSFDLAEKIPREFVKISESGISDPETVKELRSAGFQGFLMGENFMKTTDPGDALKRFIPLVTQ
ncbi:MAG: indole-3-glycerol phosphate synthase TrpC [Dysgonamonadaceae bacterium]|jgi:indole-3-glycerol phosphate synthase|nr:indole-3-glycerol phosphate synthase TrpC [Dysgonamonadaceae bacterium]